MGGKHFVQGAAFVLAGCLRLREHPCGDLPSCHLLADAHLSFVGREPLCKFLDKPFPSTEFPSGNLAAEFMPKLMSVDAERLRVAKSRACVALSGLVGALGIAVWYLSPSIAGYVVEMASG